MNVNREMLAFLRKQYPVGTRIRLDSMQDPYAPVEAGTTGKLDYIDDAGQFHMKWDNGRVLALIPGTSRSGSTIIGGLILGVSEALASAYIAVAWKDVVAFLVLILILIIRPTGLLGERTADKL